MHTWDGLVAHTVKPGDTVYVFRTLEDIDTYLAEPLAVGAPMRYAVINTEATYVLHYKNASRPNDVCTAQFLYKILSKPLEHPTYGYMKAWGFWKYTLE